MTDINPTLDRVAHGQSGGHGPHHHHDTAAHHHERAAEHHRRAAEAHRIGDTKTASTHAFQAYGHGAHAQQYANESLKGYAMTDTQAEPRAGVGAPGGDAAAGTYGLRETGSGTGGYVPATGGPAGGGTEIGYPTSGEGVTAPTTNPTAANTPSIGGAPGSR